MALIHDVRVRSSVREFRFRLLLAMWGVAAAVVLLASRLYALQVLRGEELSDKGRRNFVQQIEVPHDRGIIYDRTGAILVDNRPSLDLQVTPAFLGRGEAAHAALVHLGALTGMADDEVARIALQVAGRRGLDRFVPLTVRRDLSADEVEAIESERGLFRLDGTDIIEGRRRVYHYGAMAAHLLGYVGEIDQASLEAERGRGNPARYRPGDMIGRDGIERTYEQALRGVDGASQVVVDAKGRRQQVGHLDVLLGEQRQRPPVPGHNVFLTLDLALQQVAESRFLALGRAGSVVALDARTGAVLVLASLPAYDANQVSGSLLREVKEALDQDPLKPWINRSVAGQYAPGSTFKPFTGLAALQMGAIRQGEHIGCPGSFRLGRHVWRCWRDSGHGLVDLTDALRVSCDTFFYNAASRTGIGPIAEMARAFGLGRRTGIALRGEQPGLVPDEAFHQRVDAATGGYQRGMAINSAIGQGSLLVTPLQLAVAFAALGSGRGVLVPQLVDRVETADFRTTRRLLADVPPLGDGGIGADGVPRWLSRTLPEPQVETEVRGDGPQVVAALEAEVALTLAVTPAHLVPVRAGLRAAIERPGGTGYSARSRQVSMAGKTGTSQVVRLGRERLKGWEIDYLERDHAWFVAYAPADDPEIVLAVVNEHAGHGGSASAPIAVAVIDAYFANKARRQAPSQQESP